MKDGGNAPWVQIVLASALVGAVTYALIWDGVETVLTKYHSPGRYVPTGVHALTGSDAVNYGLQKIVAGFLIIGVVVFVYRYLNSD